MMSENYCIENDLPKQQEDSAIAYQKRINSNVSLLLAFNAVECGIGNVLTNKKTQLSGTAGQVVGNEQYRILTSGNSLGMLYEALDNLRDEIKKQINSIA